MKETINIKIIEGGMAIEVNPLGEKPVMSSFLWDRKHINLETSEVLQLFKVQYTHWEMAEMNLRTFEIETTETHELLKSIDNSIGYELNSIHQARILDNGKIEII